MRYYEVSPTAIVRADSNVLTYSSETPLQQGLIVTIPVGRKTLVGIVMRETNKPDYETKSIDSIIETTPLPPSLLRTAEWMSQYYATHLATVWQTLLPRGLTKKRRLINRSTPVVSRDRTKNVFTKDQSKALEVIQKMQTGTALLHGVTGSGKTLVYIESAKQAIQAGRSVIILVPEIALTSQLLAEFNNHFPDVLLTHSRQTEAERHTIWKNALNSDEPSVVIGPRSALFMPLTNVGLIAIDECHEPSYKQEQAPRYSALRTASILAHHHQAKVILGSATPTISDYFLAKETDSPVIEMPAPARSGAATPDIEIVDMTLRNNFTQHPFLSNQLLTSLERVFDSGHQALIFHNRRGTASTTLCQNCGWQAGCPRCFIPLTLHADDHTLRCHICAYQAHVPTSCPECGHVEVIHKGLGTKRIEEELSRLFPKQSIARFDADTAPDDTVDRRYDEIYRGDIQLIIGTQIIAKGLDLPQLRMVGIVQADAGLSLPDFTASERTFHLLSQVIGRVGRSHHPTRVVAQTYQPNHPAIQDGMAQNYADFYRRTIAQRKHTNFPPFCYLLKLVCVYKTERTAVNNSQKLALHLRSITTSPVQVLGPTPAFYERVRDTYRWQIIIKSPHRQDLVGLLEHIPKTHWQYELDPTSLL